MRKIFNSKGFTLVELLIVIAILGVLAAAVLVAINPGQKINASRNARVKSDLANIGRSAQLFNTDSSISGTCVYSTYPNAFGVTVCGLTFMAAVKDPSNTDYSIYVNYSSGTTNCDMSSTTTNCTSFSVAGTAYNDGNTPPGSNLAWCWKSSTGTVTAVATNSRANCTP